MRAQYKIDTWKAESGNLYYALFVRVWYGSWRRMDIFTSYEDCKRHYDKQKVLQLPGTPEYLP